jgi:7-cyano-7-deazaguanine reductase
MELTKLGNPDATADRRLEAFPIADRSQLITLECGEFTCRCPITGQPDWATITIEYRPDAWAVETKSVKLYLETFREEGIFHEHLATVIRDDFVAALKPVSLSVAVNFNSRGGIALRAVSSHPSP